MNKLLMLISLFLSSFFLFSFNAKAATVSVSITEDTYNLINDTFFTFKEQVEEYALNNDYDTFFIVYDTIRYEAYFYKNIDNYDFSCDLSSNTLNCYFNLSFKIGSYIENSDFYTTGSGILSINTYTFKKYLYSNIDLKIKDTATSSLTLKYSGQIYEFNAGDKFYSIYDIYKDINNLPEENPHKEELNFLSNFYNTVINKLQYISELFLSNYIYLSILVIFLLIFIFELIFRRFL